MFDEKDVPNVYWQVEIQPGGSANTTFTAPSEPGEYEVVCRTEGHIVSGMIARLNVVAGESSSINQKGYCSLQENVQLQIQLALHGNLMAQMTFVFLIGVNRDWKSKTK